MNIDRPLRAFVMAACLGLATPAWAAMDEPATSSSLEATEAASIAEARKHVDRGQYGDALDLLRPLVQGREAKPNTVFLYGLAALGAAQLPGLQEQDRDSLLDEAIAAFRAMLVDRPELVRVRLELGRAFFLKGQDGLSRRHFERVLAGNPPPPVVLNVNRFLSQIRARRALGHACRFLTRAGYQHWRNLG